MGWRILWQALRLVLRNPLAALRVSVGPLVLLALLTRATGQLMLGGPFDRGTGLVLGLLTTLVLSWVAVSWHRYVLREEAPTGVLPALSGPETLAHMGWSFVLSLGALLLGMAAGPVLARLFASLPATTTATDLVASLGPAATLMVVTGYLGLRFGLVLPAAAMGRPLTIPDSWALTQPVSGALLGLAILSPLGFVLTGFLGPIAFTAALHVGLTGAEIAITAVLAVVSWASLMLGLSLLTTLYGHLVERRPLP